MKTGSAELQQHEMAVDTENAWTVSTNLKHSLIYPALLIVLFTGVNYYFINYVSFNIANANLFYGTAFLLIGLAHIFIFPKWLSHLWDKSFSYATFYTILVALISSIVPLLFFFTAWTDISRFAIVSASAFLLPFAAYAAVYFLKNIGAKEYQPWIIPADVEPDTRKSLMLNSIHFKFRVNINETDPHPTLFVVTLSAKMKLNAVFLRFLYDKHDIIGIADNNGYSYGWLFSIKRRFGKNMLDPELTLTENGVQEGDIITAERVREYE